MDTAHLPPASPNHCTPQADDPFERAMHLLAHNGIAFEVVPDTSPLERAA